MFAERVVYYRCEQGPYKANGTLAIATHLIPVWEYFYTASFSTFPFPLLFQLFFFFFLEFFKHSILYMSVILIRRHLIAVVSLNILRNIREKLVS